MNYCIPYTVYFNLYLNEIVYGTFPEPRFVSVKQPVAPPLLYTGRSGSIIASLIHVRYSDRSHKSDGGRAIYEMAG